MVFTVEQCRRAFLIFLMEEKKIPAAWASYQFYVEWNNGKNWWWWWVMIQNVHCLTGLEAKEFISLELERLKVQSEGMSF